MHILNQFGIRLLLVALAMMAGIGPAPGQAPGIIDSSDRDAELYHRANRYYSYAQDSRDLEDKQRAYRMSIPLFREYLSAGPHGDLVQQASYKLGMALLLSGEREAAEQAGDFAEADRVAAAADEVQRRFNLCRQEQSQENARQMLRGSAHSEGWENNMDWLLAKKAASRSFSPPSTPNQDSTTSRSALVHQPTAPREPKWRDSPGAR